MNADIVPEIFNSDYVVDQLIGVYDETSMPLPSIESEPHLLISKVRKHYMDYIIKLLTLNYEKNQRLLNKNIYLPSAIWRCAKSIEVKAAQTCMVVQLYRKNIAAVIEELKKDTNKGKLNKKLFDCLHRAPMNEKKLQTSRNLHSCDCVCNCNLPKRRRKVSKSPVIPIQQPIEPLVTNREISNNEQNKIPVVINSHIDYSQINLEMKNDVQQILSNEIIQSNTNYSPKPSLRMSMESQDSDELTMQLEKLFQGDSNEDDLFDGALYDTKDTVVSDENYKTRDVTERAFVQNHDTVIENQAAQIKSLDERLTTLAGLLVSNTNNNTCQQKLETPKTKERFSSKWLCEEYFLKSRLLELLDRIGDCNRKKLAWIKAKLSDLFGSDSDDESVVSPFEETPEFIISCKERIAPWVVKILTPYYIKGRIKGKSLFKALAKHLIKLIYQCSRYPHEFEVHSFVTDFMENHKMITCEADFEEFRIENI